MCLISLDKVNGWFDHNSLMVSMHFLVVIITNKSGYPTKLDYYGFNGKIEGKGGMGVVSPYYPKTDKPMIVIPSRDQHTLNFNLDDLKIEFRDGTYCIHKSFFVVDRTGKEYKKRKPTYIAQQALDTISEVPEHKLSQQA